MKSKLEEDKATEDLRLSQLKDQERLSILQEQERALLKLQRDADERARAAIPKIEHSENKQRPRPVEVATSNVSTAEVKPQEQKNNEVPLTKNINNDGRSGMSMTQIGLIAGGIVIAAGIIAKFTIFK